MHPTTFYLIRHAEKEGGERWLPGRIPGVHLSAEGRRQAEMLAEALAGVPFTAVYSSPVQRAVDTARPLADRLGLQVHLAEEIGEIDFGEWSGSTVGDLEGKPLWDRFNVFRSGTRVPGGEAMLEVQVRFVGKVLALRQERPDRTVALVSHADPIRAALAFFLGMPLDLFLRLGVDSACVSVVEVGDYGVRVQCVNQRVFQGS